MNLISEKNEPKRSTIESTINLRISNPLPLLHHDAIALADPRNKSHYWAQNRTDGIPQGSTLGPPPLLEISVVPYLHTLGMTPSKISIMACTSMTGHSKNLFVHPFPLIVLCRVLTRAYTKRASPTAHWPPRQLGFLSKNRYDTALTCVLCAQAGIPIFFKVVHQLNWNGATTSHTTVIRPIKWVPHLLWYGSTIIDWRRRFHGYLDSGVIHGVIDLINFFFRCGICGRRCVLCEKYEWTRKKGNEPRLSRLGTG